MKRKRISYKNACLSLLQQIRYRCILNGCQYGVVGVDKEPKDKCIWCGEKRNEGMFPNVSISNLIEQNKNENNSSQKPV